ncbi:hypothetical protein [Spirosoma luteum]|uniref:hypothetical protein n=1 Tax=Spirosoma luteum TaxID=431553 RepID=UPI00039CF8E4|nr:hypothetical protein [Spirosoma luteum]
MEPRPQPQNNSRSYLLAALFILAALNLLLLYFYYQEKQENKTKDATIVAKTEEVLIAKTKLDSISAQLDSKIAEIQRLGGNIDSLMKVKTQLEKDKRELRNVGTFDQKKYNQKIRNYQAILAQKDQEIARLKEENGVLTQQNEALAEENSGLKAERQSLSDSVMSVTTKNQELAEKVSIAAALRAEAVTVNSVNTRGKENDGGTYKAKKTDKIHISVLLAPNGLAKKDEKVVYIRVLDPSGAVISDMATGSGEFTYNGQGMTYTAMQRFNFDNSRQRIDFFYGRGGQRFNPGKYNIEVYSEGFRIGEGEFAIK